jgi:hypothetical protein
MFEGWADFYILIGGASGALIGLLFVVVTLTSGMDRDRALIGSSLYMAPMVVLFAAVLVIGAIAAAPKLGDDAREWLIEAVAVLGLAYGIRVAVGVLRRRVQHWSDAWCYGVGPAAAFALLSAATALAWTGARACAPYAIGAACVAMMLLSIRNAWDLVTWMAPKGAPIDHIEPPKSQGQDT